VAHDKGTRTGVISRPTVQIIPKALKTVESWSLVGLEEVRCSTLPTLSEASGYKERSTLKRLTTGAAGAVHVKCVQCSRKAGAASYKVMDNRPTHPRTRSIWAGTEIDRQAQIGWNRGPRMRSILWGVSVDSNPTILIHLVHPPLC